MTKRIFSFIVAFAVVFSTLPFASIVQAATSLTGIKIEGPFDGSRTAMPALNTVGDAVYFEVSGESGIIDYNATVKLLYTSPNLSNGTNYNIAYAGGNDLTTVVTDPTTVWKPFSSTVALKYGTTNKQFIRVTMLNNTSFTDPATVTLTLSTIAGGSKTSDTSLNTKSVVLNPRPVSGKMGFASENPMGFVAVAGDGTTPEKAFAAQGVTAVSPKFDNAYVIISASYTPCTVEGTTNGTPIPVTAGIGYGKDKIDHLPAVILGSDMTGPQYYVLNVKNDKLQELKAYIKITRQSGEFTITGPATTIVNDGDSFEYTVTRAGGDLPVKLDYKITETNTEVEPSSVTVKYGDTGTFAVSPLIGTLTFNAGTNKAVVTVQTKARAAYSSSNGTININLTNVSPNQDYFQAQKITNSTAELTFRSTPLNSVDKMTLSANGSPHNTTINEPESGNSVIAYTISRTSDLSSSLNLKATINITGSYPIDKTSVVGDDKASYSSDDYNEGTNTRTVSILMTGVQTSSNFTLKVPTFSSVSDPSDDKTLTVTLEKVEALQASGVKYDEQDNHFTSQMIEIFNLVALNKIPAKYTGIKVLTKLGTALSSKVGTVGDVFKFRVYFDKAIQSPMITEGAKPYIKLQVGPVKGNNVYLSGIGMEEDGKAYLDFDYTCTAALGGNIVFDGVPQIYLINALTADTISSDLTVKNESGETTASAATAVLAEGISNNPTLGAEVNVISMGVYETTGTVKNLKSSSYIKAGDTIRFNVGYGSEVTPTLIGSTIAKKPSIEFKIGNADKNAVYSGIIGDGKNIVTFDYTVTPTDAIDANNESTITCTPAINMNDSAFTVGGIMLSGQIYTPAVAMTIENMASESSSYSLNDFVVSTAAPVITDFNITYAGEGAFLAPESDITIKFTSSVPLDPEKTSILVNDVASSATLGSFGNKLNDNKENSTDKGSHTYTLTYNLSEASQNLHGITAKLDTITSLYGNGTVFEIVENSGLNLIVKPAHLDFLDDKAGTSDAATKIGDVYYSKKDTSLTVTFTSDEPLKEATMLLWAVERSGLVDGNVVKEEGMITGGTLIKDEEENSHLVSTGDAKTDEGYLNTVTFNVPELAVVDAALYVEVSAKDMVSSPISASKIYGDVGFDTTAPIIKSSTFGPVQIASKDITKLTSGDIIEYVFVTNELLDIQKSFITMPITSPAERINLKIYPQPVNGLTNTYKVTYTVGQNDKVKLTSTTALPYMLFDKLGNNGNGAPVEKPIDVDVDNDPSIGAVAIYIVGDDGETKLTEDTVVRASQAVKYVFTANKEISSATVDVDNNSGGWTPTVTVDGQTITVTFVAPGSGAETPTELKFGLDLKDKAETPNQKVVTYEDFADKDGFYTVQVDTKALAVTDVAGTEGYNTTTCTLVKGKSLTITLNKDAALTSLLRVDTNGRSVVDVMPSQTIVTKSDTSFEFAPTASGVYYMEFTDMAGYTVPLVFIVK